MWTVTGRLWRNLWWVTLRDGQGRVVHRARGWNQNPDVAYGDFVWTWEQAEMKAGYESAWV